MKQKPPKQWAAEILAAHQGETALLEVQGRIETCGRTFALWSGNMKCAQKAWNVYNRETKYLQEVKNELISLLPNKNE